MAPNTTSWKDIRKRRVRGKHDERAVKAERDLLELQVSLAELRRRRALTQERLATELGVSQSNVSRIERQDDVALSTLYRYIDGLGGRLEIKAVFDDESVELTAA
jgi:DNA-binding XRE family transcriptional regulator